MVTTANSSSTLMRLRLWVVVVPLMVAGALACEQGDLIEVVNGRGETVLIDVGNGPPFPVEPGDSALVGPNGRRAYTFAVLDSDGVQIAEYSFSWEEWQAMDFRIVVE